MLRKYVAPVVALAVGSLLGLVSIRVHAQASQPAGEPAGKKDAGTAAPDKPYDWRASFAQYPVGKVARMAYGKPDLQGVWSRNITTPLERRPDQKKTTITQTEAENAEEAAHQRAINLRIEPTDTPPGEKTTDAYNSFWRENYFMKSQITSLRTSQVVDPPNGRIPPLTKEALQKRYKMAMMSDRPAMGPEDRPLDSRCIRPLGVGPAYTGGGMGETFTLVQDKEEITIRPEALETQRIYLDGRALPPDNIRLDQGASRGHWEGDVLVVETTNFKEAGTREGTAQMHLEERWKRLDDTHLLYGFTVDDPGTWAKPWSVELVMWRMTNQEQVVEYACHEGNVGIEFTLSAARAMEDEAQKQAQPAK